MNLVEGAMERQPRAMLGGLVLVVLLCAALLWWNSDTPLLAAIFAGGIACLLGGAYVLQKSRPAPVATEFAAPDWSVTVAAIERPGEGVAVVDRANRLNCANSTWREWFGPAAPPKLDLETASVEALAKLSREAWRDGTAETVALRGADGQTEYRASATRAGRGEDYLIWRFECVQHADPSEHLSQMISGQFGDLLSRAGIEAALVGPDGTIRAVAGGFAERAAGDGSATLAGQEFVSFLRTDERERIFFARDGRRGAPQTLVHVPLDPPEAAHVSAATEAPSLMLLVDSGVGIGGALEGAGSGANAPQLEALLGALPLGLAMIDRDGRFLFGNEAFLRASGREGTGLPPFPSDLVVREDKAALSDAVRRYGKGPAASGDMAIRLSGQPDDPASLGLAGVRGLGEAAVLLSLADSSEETRLKQQLAQQTKMQAVGKLAGGVAHDFNNVLTAIIGYCDLMLLRHTPGDSDYDDIQQIRANSNRAASLTRQLLAFSRQQTLRPEVLQLPDVVSEVSQLLTRLMGEKIEFKVRHDRDLGPVRADPQQLEQVIVNLAVNARDAIQAHGDGSGKVSMTTRRVSTRDVRAMNTEILPPADYTVLVVQDTGGGIPDDLLGKIFEPFFTTKEQGKGTGLGLSTVYGIVKQTGGFIFADNVSGADGRTEGARFSIYLPVHRGEMPVRTVENAPEAETPASSWQGGGRILLVEDEDMVRAVAERALARAGHTITACADGEEGLEAITAGGEFDLIVSDVVMPGMDGPAMARAIRKLQPDLPVLFMSGYAEEQLRKDIDIPKMHFIAKPFSVSQIGDAVAAALKDAVKA